MRVVAAVALTLVLHPVTSRSLDGPELLKIGDLHALQQHHAEALPYYERAAEAFRRGRNIDGQAAALEKVATMLDHLGRTDDGFTAARTALALAPRIQDAGIHARVQAAYGRACAAVGRTEEAISAYRRADDLFGGARLWRERNAARVRLAELLADVDRPGAKALLDAVESDSRQRGAVEDRLAALLALGEWHRVGGEYDAAHRHLREGLELARGHGDVHWQAAFRIGLARALAAAGRSEDSRAMAREALHLYQAIKDRAGEAAARALADEHTVH